MPQRPECAGVTRDARFIVEAAYGAIELMSKYDRMLARRQTGELDEAAVEVDGALLVGAASVVGARLRSRLRSTTAACRIPSACAGRPRGRRAYASRAGSCRSGRSGPRLRHRRRRRDRSAHRRYRRCTRPAHGHKSRSSSTCPSPARTPKPAPYRLQTLTYSTGLAFTGRSGGLRPRQRDDTRFAEPRRRLLTILIDDPPF